LCIHIGCATYTLQLPPPEGHPVELDTLEDAAALLSSRYGKMRSLKASGEMHTRFPNEEHWRQTSFALIAEKPARVRMRVYRPLVPTLFDFSSDGRSCWLFIPADKTAYHNEGCESLSVGGNYVIPSTETIVSALFVVPQPEELASGHTILTQEPDFVRLEWREETGVRKQIWVRASTGLVARQVFTGPEDTQLADITYTEYTSVDGTAVPVALEVSLPSIGAALTLRIQKVEVNTTVSPEAFSFFPPSGTRILESTSSAESFHAE
jgi:outer membrane lipoprotein-sorting protein